MMLMQTRPTPRRRPAFTLLELLIVIGIIALLTVLGFSLAGKVTGRGKVGATTDTLKLLDQALTAYIEAEGGNPPAWVVDPRPANSNEQRVVPVVDGVNFSGPNQPINSVGLFLVQCRKVPAADAMLKQVDPKFVREFDPDGPGNDSNFSHQTSLTTIFDAWDRPIRYVHPQFKGQIFGPTYSNQSNFASPIDLGVSNDTPVSLPPDKLWGIRLIRRNATVPVGTPSADGPDADGGIAPSARPYFYSLGPDGKAGKVVDSSGKVVEDYNADNVYLVMPRTQN